MGVSYLLKNKKILIFCLFLRHEVLKMLNIQFSVKFDVFCKVLLLLRDLLRKCSLVDVLINVCI